MENKVWREALQAAPDPQRATEAFERWQSSGMPSSLRKPGLEHASILASVFSGSQALTEMLFTHPEWAEEQLAPSLLNNGRRKQGLEREVAKWLESLVQEREFSSAFARLRVFKQQQILRIGARDLARLADVAEITHELSDLADICLDAVYRLVVQQLSDRFGQPYHTLPGGGWQPTPFCIVGLGKLGGQELNYSSDVDVIFVYGEEGFVFKEPPARSSVAGKGLSNHQFFARVCEAIVSELIRMTPEGMLYRIDLRLRPEGPAGPLARSLASYENYYAQWGQTWERMMAIKARPLAGDAALGAEFLEMIQPFRFPRSLGEGTLREIANLKRRTEEEVVKEGELNRNVKLGRGGIREIEFVVQTLQILNAGRMPFLQLRQTLPTLEKLVQYHLLPAADAVALKAAYLFLRQVEHRLQMENAQQTHTIPTERRSRERLAALMGFPTLLEFEETHEDHRRRVREIYDQLLSSEPPPHSSSLPHDLTASKSEWRAILQAHSFRDPDQALHLAELFVHGPGYVHVSPRTSDLALGLLGRILSLCPRRDQPAALPISEEGVPIPDLESTILSDPDRILARLDSYVGAYGSRSMLYEMWSSKPSLFRLLVLLFDRSEFLAEMAIRTPDLVDELELSGHLRRRKKTSEILNDLRHGEADKDQSLWIRRYHQTEFMRLGLREILGLADFEQNLVELSALAEACLQYALEVVLRKRRRTTAPFAVIGLGKLGGAELNYGSDLDIIFVAPSKAKNLPDLQRLALQVIELLATPSELGSVFKTDTRLRPDGEKGVLVNTLDAYEDYYRRRAMLWEIQALTRIRPVAGDLTLGHRFQQMSAQLTDFRSAPQLNAYTPAWRAEIARMRGRIEHERTPAGQEGLAIKTGAGGLIDAEFMAQVLCLAHGHQEPNTLQALRWAREENLLASISADSLIQSYRELRRIECVLRRWSFEGEAVLPQDPAPLYRVAVRCGYGTTDRLLAAVAAHRTVLRRAYQSVVEPPPRETSS